MRPRFRATLGQQRTFLTYAAFVADDSSLQPLLPQFVVGSQATAFQKRHFGKLFHASPDQVFLLSGKTAWITHTQMVQILEVVAAVCKKAKPEALIMLAWDMASCHLHT